MSAEDSLAIANLKSLYCATADRAAHDPASARTAFAPLFATDVIAEYGYGPLSSAEAVIDFLCTAIAGNSEWMVHMLHSPRIHVEGDRATGDWTVAIRSKRREDGEIQDVFGRYSDDYQRDAGGWKIHRINFQHYV